MNVINVAMSNAHKQYRETKIRLML